MTRDFQLLWAGHTISEFGTAVSGLALPLLAVTMLNATPLETGLLAGASTAGWLLVSLPAGAIVDRLPKRVVMLACDVCRAVILVSIGVAALTGDLLLWHLFVGALALGVPTVVYEAAARSVLPLLVPPDQLVRANGRLATVTALAYVSGPPAASLLARLSPLVDGLSYVVNLVFLSQLTVSEPPRNTTNGKLSKEMREGLSFVLRHPVLNRIVLTSATTGICRGWIGALLVVFLVRDLHASGTVIGLAFGLGGAGGIIGGLATQPLARQFGSARLLWLAPLAVGSLVLLMPLATAGFGVVLVAFGYFADGVSSMIYNILQISYRQSICPPGLQGRMNASFRWLIRGGTPLGALAAGALASLMPVRAVLAIGVAGLWAAIFWVIRSPLRLHRDIPTAHAGSHVARTGRPHRDRA